MSNYTIVLGATGWSSKDSLALGNALKYCKATDIQNELNAIQVAVNSKYDSTTTTITLAGMLSASGVTVTTATIPANGIYLSAANTLAFASNTTLRGSVNATGNWALVAPTAGVTLTVPAFAANWATIIQGNAGVAFQGSGPLGLATSKATNATTDYAGIDFINFNSAVPQARIAAIFAGGGSTLAFGTSNNYGTGITNTAMTINNVGTISGLGVTAAGLVNMSPDTGTFTATLTGCTTSPTVTVTWVRSGNIVTVQIPSVLATSNTTACSLTGVPAVIQPATLTQNCVISVNNNGSNVVGTLNVAPGSGTYTLGIIGGTFSNVGTKGVSVNYTVTYLLT